MKAGKPTDQDGFIEKDIDGIMLYVRKDMANKPFKIGWFGIWIFGYFNVVEG